MDEGRQDFAAKLTLIEREAGLVLEDLPPAARHDQAQNIATLARLLRLRLDVASSLILGAAPNPEQKDFAEKLELMETEAKLVLAKLPPGLTRDRLEHIAAMARQLNRRLAG